MTDRTDDRGQRTKDLAEECFARSSLHPLSSVFCPLSFVLQDYYEYTFANLQLGIGNIGYWQHFHIGNIYPALRSRRGATLTAHPIPTGTVPFIVQASNTHYFDKGKASQKPLQRLRLSGENLKRCAGRQSRAPLLFSSRVLSTTCNILFEILQKGSTTPRLLIPAGTVPFKFQRGLSPSSPFLL
jgi:hypothetical protein